MADSLARTWRRTIRESKVVTSGVGVMAYTVVYASSLTICGTTGNPPYYYCFFIHTPTLLLSEPVGYGGIPG